MMKSLSPCALLYEEENIGSISHLAFSSRGLLAIGCKGAKMWDISSGKLPNDSLVAFDGASMAAIALSPDGSRIAIGQENGVAIFDIATARRRQAVTSAREHGQQALPEPTVQEVGALPAMGPGPLAQRIREVIWRIQRLAERLTPQGAICFSVLHPFAYTPDLCGLCGERLLPPPQYVCSLCALAKHLALGTRFWYDWITQEMVHRPVVNKERKV